uniref:ShKT domain-containing protein n=1 Tax=Steinernema glaseri TaxID=37863 RepID=A0A1I7Y532_9BILA
MFLLLSCTELQSVYIFIKDKTIFAPLGTTFFSLLIASLFVVAPAQHNVDPCKIYEVVDDYYKCGPEGYFISEEKPFCRLVTSPMIVGRYTLVGFQTVVCIHNCLIMRTGDYLTGKTAPLGQATCEELNRVNKEQHHPQCYDACGFCKINRKDAGEEFFDLVNPAYCNKN